MKLFSLGTVILLFNLMMSNEFSLTSVGGGSNICQVSCDLKQVKKGAISKALEDGKNKLFNECEAKRSGVITNISFPKDSEVKCDEYEVEGGELISCKAEITGQCDIS